MEHFRKRSKIPGKFPKYQESFRNVLESFLLFATLIEIAYKSFVTSLTHRIMHSLFLISYVLPQRSDQLLIIINLISGKKSGIHVQIINYMMFNHF